MRQPFNQMHEVHHLRVLPSGSPWIQEGPVKVGKTCLYQNGGMGGHHGNKGAARKAVRIKLLSLSQPRSSHNPHPEPTRQPPKHPQRTKATEPHPAANAKPQGRGGAAEGTGKIQQNTGTQGFQNEIPQAV